MLKDLLILEDKKLVTELLSNMHAKDIADELANLDDSEVNLLISLLDEDEKIEVFSYLPLDLQALFLLNNPLEEQVEIIENLEPDDARDILLTIELDNRKTIISKLDDEAKVLELVHYDEDEAGSYMNNLFVQININLSIKEATKQVINDAGKINDINMIYIVNNDNQYVGAISLIALIKAKPSDQLKDLLKTEETFSDVENVYKLAEHIKYYQLKEVAITNNDNKLIGVVTSDDILDLLADDFEDDFESLMALPDSSDSDSIMKTAFARIPWLSILLVIGIPIAFLTSYFEEVIAGAVILAMFQPLILDSGGNVGTQTLAVSLITIDDRDNIFISNGIKEIISGFITSVIMALSTFIITYIVAVILKNNDPLIMSLIISLSILVSIVIGSVLGFLVPLMLKKFKIDPVAASGPLITTIIDVCSLVFYFGLATILLGGL